MEVTHLPPYHPSEAEKKDSKLFARNVRAAIAAVTHTQPASRNSIETPSLHSLFCGWSDINTDP